MKIKTNKKKKGADDEDASKQQPRKTDKDWNDYDERGPWSIPEGAAMIVKQIAAEQIFLGLVDCIVDKARSPDHKAIATLLHQFPGLCHRTYTVKWDNEETRELYPFSIICCLQPPDLDLLRFIHQVFPDALHYKEPVKDTTPFHLACTFQASLDVVDWLLEQHPQFVQTQRKDLMFPLHLAIFFEAPMDVLDRLIEVWPAVAEEQAPQKWSILHAAANPTGSTRLDVVQKIYRLSPDSLVAVDDRQRTPLHQACWKEDNSSVIQFLVQQAPHMLHVEDNSGETPLFRAVRTQSLDLLRELLPQDPPMDELGATVLHFAAMDNTVNVVEYLLERHPEMTQCQTTCRDRYTPLHSASHFCRSVDNIRALVEHSPQTLHIQNGHGQTPLQTAMQHNTDAKDVIEYLRQVTMSSKKKRKKFLSGAFRRAPAVTEDEDDE